MPLPYIHALSKAIEMLVLSSSFNNDYWFIPVLKDGKLFHGFFKIVSFKYVEITYYPTRNFGRPACEYIFSPWETFRVSLSAFAVTNSKDLEHVLCEYYELVNFGSFTFLNLWGDSLIAITSRSDFCEEDLNKLFNCA